ncbi:MAG: hypothetical protein JNK72_07750 [Myxococcales bacterium]|nr:hypothetical protein [Myxococcales bacterium]
MRITSVLKVFGWASLMGCATGRIPNTDVPDTSVNRAVVSFCERYRHAVEGRDARTLLSITSPNYYEDSGTPRGDDDYGYDGLQRLVTAWADDLLEVRYEMRYRRVTVDPDRPERIFIDYTYSGSYTLRRPRALETNRRGTSMLTIDPVRDANTSSNQDEVWSRRVGDNRLEIERVGDDFRILSGM